MTYEQALVTLQTQGLLAYAYMDELEARLSEEIQARFPGAREVARVQDEIIFELPGGLGPPSGASLAGSAL